MSAPGLDAIDAVVRADAPVLVDQDHAGLFARDDELRALDELSSRIHERPAQRMLEAGRRDSLEGRDRGTTGKSCFGLRA